MSNISPQYPELNRGVWKKLEEKIRDWIVTHDSLFVITGPLFSDDPIRIGVNEVAIPKAFFKVIADITVKP